MDENETDDEILPKLELHRLWVGGAKSPEGYVKA